MVFDGVMTVVGLAFLLTVIWMMGGWILWAGLVDLFAGLGWIWSQ